MKTLQSKKLSQYIFESVGDIRGYPDLDLVTLDNVKEWLTQKRQRTIDLYNNGKDAENFLDELLEELSE